MAAGIRRGRRWRGVDAGFPGLGPVVEEDGLDAAELVDTSGRGTGLGGRVNDGERRRLRRAMGKEGAAWIWEGEGEAQRPRGASGRDGRRPRRRGGLILPRRRRGGAAGTGPCSDPGRGNREGEGDPGRWARPAGPGVGPVGPGSSGGEGGFSSSLFFVCFSPVAFSFLFIYFLFCFNSFKSI